MSLDIYWRKSVVSQIYVWFFLWCDIMTYIMTFFGLSVQYNFYKDIFVVKLVHKQKELAIFKYSYFVQLFDFERKTQTYKNSIFLRTFLSGLYCFGTPKKVSSIREAPKKWNIFDQNFDHLVNASIFKNFRIFQYLFALSKFIFLSENGSLSSEPLYYIVFIYRLYYIAYTYENV